MCSSPILIKNPYYSRGSSFEHNGKKVRLDIGGRFDYLHDTISQYIQVPCGKCSQCLSMRQGFVNQRIQMESFRSELFFFTLTYANRGLCYTNVLDYHLAYPNYKDIQSLFKAIRKVINHPIRYYVVSEYGGKKGRPHFHGILAVDRLDIDKYYRGSRLYCEKVFYRLFFKHWRRNISKSHKCPLYISLSDHIVRGKKRTFDFRWIEPIRGHDNDISFYISKYILKYSSRVEKLITKIKLDSRLDDTQTKDLISLVKTRSVMSKDFGSYKLSSVARHVSNSLKKVSDYPTFIDINTGNSMLLSPYYRKRFVTLDMKFDKFWDYLHEVQLLDVPQSIESYNPELIGKDIVADINRKAFQSIQQNKHLNRVRNLLCKK